MSGMLMVALPWWATDTFTLIASYINAEVLAAQTVIRNFTLLTFMVPVGISIATTIMIGNNIGAMRTDVAKFYAKIGGGITFTWAIFIVIVLNIFTKPIISLFNSHDSVTDIVVANFYIVSIYILFDVLQGITMGPIRGLGMQFKAAMVTLVGYWCIGIPLSCYLVFYKNMGFTGLWIGPAAAISFNFLVYCIIVKATDWDAVA